MKSFVSKSSLTQIMRHSRPTLVISDWDETITEEDTIKYVAQVPYIKQRQQRVLPPFEKFVESYNQNYTNLKTRLIFQTLLQLVLNVPIIYLSKSNSKMNYPLSKPIN